MQRLGFIIPSVNVAMEQDLRLFLPATLGGHVGRWKTYMAHDEAQRALADVPRVAAELADAEVDAIAFACTAGSLVGGAAARREIVDMIGGATGRPSVTTADALFQSFAHLGLRRIVFFSPFDEAFSQPEIEGLREGGIEVVRAYCMGVTSSGACAAVTPGQIVDWVAASDTDGADGVFIACANFRAFEAVDALEQRLGLPVVTSNQAVLWATCRLLGLSPSIAGGGRLFN